MLSNYCILNHELRSVKVKKYELGTFYKHLEYYRQNRL